RLGAAARRRLAPCPGRDAGRRHPSQRRRAHGTCVCARTGAAEDAGSVLVARRAPAVERAVAVLNLLAAHPQQRYTLSEIARDLKLNKATLHAILGALTDEGYLVRDPAAKSYALGPALVALGNSAVSTYPAAECAVPEMRALTDELGLDCVASAAISDEIVILARAGVPRPFGVYIQAW